MNLIKLRKLVHGVYTREYFMAKCFIYQYIFDTQQGDRSEPLPTPLLAVEDHQYYIFTPKSQMWLIELGCFIHHMISELNLSS